MDKQLLDMAAKAYIDSSWHNDAAYMAGFMSKWNPLEDDGDALRLAVKLNICVVINGMFAHAEMHHCQIPNLGYVEENSARNGGCIFKAVRVAIVRAAATIGEEML